MERLEPLSGSNAIWGSIKKIYPEAGVPDASLYHKVAVYMQIIDWFHHSSSKLWVQLEGCMNPADLCALLWTSPALRKGP